jgi:Tfp pilus assembly major pilin PilA
LRLPDAFSRLRREQQVGALAALEKVEAEVQQLVLDEWAARCEDAVVRNPAGYLFGIIQKAMRGEFRAWAAQKTQDRFTTLASPATPERTPAAASAQSAQQHIAELRRMLNIR